MNTTHFVEAWGRGVPLILESAPETTFFEIGGLFVTRLERKSFKSLLADDTKETPQKHQGNTKETPKKHQRNTQKTLKPCCCSYCSNSQSSASVR